MTGKDYKQIRKEFLKKKLINEIIKLTDQQTKHREKLQNGDTSKHIKRFIAVVNKMILEADAKLQKLIQEESNVSK